MPDKPNADRLPTTMHASGPRSYDDLVRRRVPLPDSSFRPTSAEERSAEEPRDPAVTGPDAGALRAALDGLAHVDVADVQVETRGTTAIVSGSVARGYDRDRIVAALHGVSGVAEVVDRLRVRLG